MEMTNLQHAARNVIDNWASGDLAGAVNQLEEAFDASYFDEAKILEVQAGDELPAVRMLQCANEACGHIGLPKLVEHGHQVTHRLVTIHDDEIQAEGWDGSSSDVSDDGEFFTFDCAKCGAQYALPEGMEVNWL